LTHEARFDEKRAFFIETARALTGIGSESPKDCRKISNRGICNAYDLPRLAGLGYSVC
jgi:hypothetical protein